MLLADRECDTIYERLAVMHDVSKLLPLLEHVAASKVHIVPCVSKDTALV